MTAYPKKWLNRTKIGCHPSTEENVYYRPERGIPFRSGPVRCLFIFCGGSSSSFSYTLLLSSSTDVLFNAHGSRPLPPPPPPPPPPSLLFIIRPFLHYHPFFSPYCPHSIHTHTPFSLFFFLFLLLFCSLRTHHSCTHLCSEIGTNGIAGFSFPKSVYRIRIFNKLKFESHCILKDLG